MTKKNFLLRYSGLILSGLFLLILTGETVLAAAPELTITGPWSVQLKDGDNTFETTIAGTDYYTPTDEKYDSLPVFNPDGGFWGKGTLLFGSMAQGCPMNDVLIPDSVEVRLTPGGKKLERGKDYEFDNVDSQLGRLEGGKIPADTPVYVTYKSAMMRLDSIVRNADGSYELLQGKPDKANPVLPELKEGQVRLANIYIPGIIEKLSDNELFPILTPPGEFVFDKSAEPVAKKLLPKTWAKLNAGEEVRILAWGDSVTECTYLPEEEHWQNQFAERLQAAFPKAKVVLMSEGWGGRTTSAYLSEPAGSPRNYQEKVLDLKPDLIISEFVNDAGLDQNLVNELYARIRDDFKNIGAEWIICTPHYVRPSWMAIDRQKNIDDDPRPYVIGIRQFAKENNIAVADAAKLYGQLWRQGIPYITVMVNNINHPNKEGLKLFADALMNLFQ